MCDRAPNTRIIGAPRREAVTALIPMLFVLALLSGVATVSVRAAAALTDQAGCPAEAVASTR